MVLSLTGTRYPKRPRARKTFALGRACVRCGADAWYSPKRPRCAACVTARTREWCAANIRRVWAGQAVKNARIRARKYQLPFDITVDDLLGLLGDACPVLGTPWTFGGYRSTNPSVDRLYPDCGYVRGNIAVISVRANQIKSNASLEEIQKVAAWMPHAA